MTRKRLCPASMKLAIPYATRPWSAAIRPAGSMRAADPRGQLE